MLITLCHCTLTHLIFAMLYQVRNTSKNQYQVKLNLLLVHIKDIMLYFTLPLQIVELYHSNLISSTNLTHCTMLIKKCRIPDLRYLDLCPIQTDYKNIFICLNKPFFFLNFTNKTITEHNSQKSLI